MPFKKNDTVSLDKEIKEAEQGEALIQHGGEDNKIAEVHVSVVVNEVKETKHQRQDEVKETKHQTQEVKLTQDEQTSEIPYSELKENSNPVPFLKSEESTNPASLGIDSNEVPEEFKDGPESFIDVSNKVPVDEVVKTQRCRGFWVQISRLLWGSDFTWNTAWPLTLMGLLVHDIYSFYTQPTFDNTLFKILAGLPIADRKNYWKVGASIQATWSNHLGSDLVAGTDLTINPRYWLGIGLAVGLPMLNYVWRYIRQRGFEKPLQENEYKKVFTTSFCHDTTQWLLPLISQDYRLARLEYAVVYHKKLSDERTKFFKLIAGKQGVVIKHGYLARWRALGALANIAYNLRGKHDDSIGEAALTRLQEFASGKYGCLGALRANYLLWSIGQNKYSALHFIFWPAAFYILYANVRLSELIWQKIVGAYTYHDAEKSCTSSEVGKIWQYQPQIADYDCTVCADWRFVYFGAVNNIQGCLDALLGSQLSPQEIVGNMPRLLKLSKPSNITRIDLSKQNWPTWLYSEWTGLIDMLISHSSAIGKLTLVNLSLPILNKNWVDNGKIAYLPNLFQAIPIIQFDISNRWIGPALLNELMPTFVSVNSSIENLILTGNNLRSSVTLLAQNIPNMPRLKKLGVGNNGITNDDFAALGMGARNSSLISIVADSNLIFCPGLANFSLSMPYMSLETLDLSYNSFTYLCMDSLGYGLTQSRVKTLRMAGCGLGGDEMTILSPYFPKTPLEMFDGSDNQIDDPGGCSVFVNLPGSLIGSLNLGDNMIGDATLVCAAANLSNTFLKILHIPNNSFSLEAFIELVKSFIGTAIEYIDVSRNSLEDGLATALAEAINNGTKLRGVDVSNCGITDLGGVALMDSLVNSVIAVLNLSDNMMTGLTLSQLTKNLSQLLLVYLDFSGNQAINGVLKDLASAAKGSALKTLKLNNLKLTSLDVISFSEPFVAAIPNFKSLANPQICNDELRALMQVKNPTNLTNIEFNGNILDDRAGILECRIAQVFFPSANQLQLGKNNINANVVNVSNCAIYAQNDVDTCQNSAASRAAPSANLILTILAGLFILYVLDMLASSSKNIFSVCTQTFFAKCRKNTDKIPVELVHVKPRFWTKNSNTLVNDQFANHNLLSKDKPRFNTHIMS